MNYFKKEKNALNYIKMAEGYDGKELIEILKSFLSTGSTILELGMGPGKDLDILKQDYIATGSDYSQVFLDLYMKNNENADLLLLDAISIETERKFDCIYSNKVLVHLTEQELIKSIKRQSEILSPGGLVFHSFWKGDGSDNFDGLHFTYYSESQLFKIIEEYFEIIEIKGYQEMDDDDSIYVIGKLK